MISLFDQRLTHNMAMLRLNMVVLKSLKSLKIRYYYLPPLKGGRDNNNKEKRG